VGERSKNSASYPKVGGPHVGTFFRSWQKQSEPSKIFRVHVATYAPAF
jgi:hypothetical protein